VLGPDMSVCHLLGHQQFEYGTVESAHIHVVD
jgi:hypothetical protein